MTTPDTDPLKTREEAAAFLRRPTATLAAWAYRGIGPAFYRVGRSVLYKQSDLERWLEEQKVAGR